MDDLSKFNGEELLLGMMSLRNKARDAEWAIKEHDLPKGCWRRIIDPDGEAFCNIVTKRFVIGIMTGRVIFLDRKTKKRLDPIMGFHHLITGDVKCDESELAVLENGKHFHIIDLNTFEVKKKVTVPRGTYTGDVYCTYSDDGKILTVPVQLYDYNDRCYRYFRCEYETENYTLVSKTEIKRENFDRWSDKKE